MIISNRKYFWLLFFCLIITVFFVSCNQKTNVEIAKLQLGHYLFFDTHLSGNNTKSCASCHDPKFAFTDGYRKSISPRGENLLHNAPSLLNTNNYHFYDWANSDAVHYKKQIQRPLYGKHPVELGLDLHWDNFKSYILSNVKYRQLLKKAFGNAKTVSKNLVEDALVAYLQTLQSRQSDFDKFAAGDQAAINQNAQRGFTLFTSKKLNCVQCHMPPDFTITTRSKNIDSVFTNIGLYENYPMADAGLFMTSQNERDKGKFRVPSLRNVMLTAPYMHDGSVQTISEVIDIYANGGRANTANNFYGNGALNKNKHSLITGFEISAKEKKELIAFLETLTDTTYLNTPNFLNPFDN